MQTNGLPVFTVSTVEPNSPQLKGEVSRWCWIGEEHIAYLLLDDGSCVEGKFLNVSEADQSASFAFKNPDAALRVKPGESVRYLDCYWGERARIALDPSLDWKLQVSPHGNTHDHCEICWATISEEDTPSYMKSSGDNSVCLDCFRNHVEARNLDFIVGPPSDA